MKTGLLQSIRARAAVFGRATLIAAFLWLPATVSSAQNRVEIDSADDLVTIVADAADLKLILQELALESGIKFWISQDLPARQLTLRIENQPMEAALRKLLQNVSYALVRAEDETISAVYVLPEGEEGLAEAPQPQTNVDVSQIIVDATQNAGVADAINQMLENIPALGNAASSQTSPETGAPPAGAVEFDAIREVLQQLQDSTSDIRQRLEAGTPGIVTQ